MNTVIILILWGNMNSQEKFEYWLDMAQYDLKTAQAMLETGRWFYVFFMCQQAIEKLIKGLYLLYIDDNVPRLHDINGIFDRFKDSLPEKLSDERISLFDTLSQVYLRSRYPDYSPTLYSQITQETAQAVYEKSKGAFEWLLTMTP